MRIMPPLISTILMAFIIAGGQAAADDSIPFTDLSEESLARDQRAVQWVLERRGQIGIEEEDGNRRYGSVPNLGSRRLRLLHIQFPRPSKDRRGERELTFCDDDLKVFKKLDSLTSLAIARTPCTGEFIKYLTECPKLTGLRIAGENVESASLAGLPRLKSIQHLSLGGPKLTETCLKHVAAMTNLESLHFGGLGVDGKGFAALSQLKTLRQLNLETENLPPAAFKAVAALPQITGLYLELGPTAEDDNRLQPLGAMAALKSLSLFGSVSDADLFNMSHAARLKNLSISHELEPSSALAHLRNCPELRELELSIGSPSEEGLEHLKGLRNLKKLALFVEELSDVGCGHLSELTALQSLRIHCTNFRGEGLAHLARLDNLTKLMVNSSSKSWSAEGARQIATLQQLRNLNLGGNLDDGALASIGKLQNLTNLFIDGEQVSDDGLSHLAALAQLESLFIATSQISDGGLAHLGKLKALKSLTLSHVEIAKEAFEQFSQLSNLESLSFFYTTIGREGLARLAGLEPLRKLDLYESDITEAQTDALARMNRLTELKIHSFREPPAGLATLRTKLKDCKVEITYGNQLWRAQDPDDDEPEYT